MMKTLGGDRLGAGKKMQVELHGYERSTHNLGYLWRSTMSSGTLVPFMSEVALPGDTFDIDLDCDIKTHPTVGPLFGSYKVQLDIFLCPVRLYQGQLHNNKMGIGMNMAAVKLPLIQVPATVFNPEDVPDVDNAQINPSCILSYLGIRGVGLNAPLEATTPREFNAVPFLSYWDIYKNYYANKQEEIGAVIHTPRAALIQTVDDIEIQLRGFPAPTLLDPAPNVSPMVVQNLDTMLIAYTGAVPDPMQIMIKLDDGREIPAGDLFTGFTDTTTQLIGTFNWNKYGNVTVVNWRYVTEFEVDQVEPGITTFPLANLDNIREEILNHTTNVTPFTMDGNAPAPFGLVLDATGDYNHMLSTQEGLGLKTYQSDLFNNWLSTEWIDGAGGINEITAIDTSGGSFNLDTLVLSRKVYDMLNRIAVSGGSYDDWLDAVYTNERFKRAETPMYMGGLIKELVFQEVVSNSQSATGDGGAQPLGTLAGKGVMASKHKGGKVTVKVDEISYIIGIISLTPRVDYSQGNKWDVHLLTMDDFHKPGLDGIGFQELITEQMAWWSTRRIPGAGTAWETRSAGKQPAWVNYMTNVNQTRGNFAIDGNEMFMTLNRRYEADPLTGEITDLTTYIDPKKFNNIFADTARDAQNFWAQISVDITARRKMSAKIMPNL